MQTTHTYGETVMDFTIGQVVEAHPGCDCWMMGDRFGRVDGFGGKLVKVKMDRSGKVRRFPPDLLRIVEGGA